MKLLRKLPSNKTSGLPGECYLLPGMPVMLTTNIATELGLTNGSCGTLEHIVCDARERQKPTNTVQVVLEYQIHHAIVSFPGTKCPKLDGLPDKHIPVFPVKGTFCYKFPGSKRSITITRTQIPLNPAYAITSYKSQGKTLPSAIVDLLPPKYHRIDTSFAYVPLSRVRRLEDLVILRPFPVTVLHTKKSQDHKAQDERFSKLESKSA